MIPMLLASSHCGATLIGGLAASRTRSKLETGAIDAELYTLSNSRTINVYYTFLQLIIRSFLFVQTGKSLPIECETTNCTITNHIHYNMLYNPKRENIEINFMWVPAHRQIPVNARSTTTNLIRVLEPEHFETKNLNPTIPQSTSTRLESTT